jgi:hypothetical protein
MIAAAILRPSIALDEAGPMFGDERAHLAETRNPSVTL